MKYNDDAFNISAQYYSDIQELETDDINRKCWNKLLQILLKRFLKELEENKTQNNGIIKTRFKSPFCQDSDEGYHLIKELVESQKFDSFASQYCFYLGDIENRSDECDTSYFQIIWDYKTYFESLSMSQIDAKIESANLSKNTFIESLIEFKQLPLKYQIAILESFSSKVSECKTVFLQEEAVNICLSEGHQFSKWKKETHVSYKDAWIDHQLIPNYRVEHQTWDRICSRCGFKESVEQEPQELIDDRKEKNKQARIKRLEKELKKLKEES